MGILSESKLKDHVSIQEFVEALEDLHHRIRSKILALIGLAGRIKGLPIVYVTTNNYDLKLFSAKLNEFIDPLKKLFQYEKVKDFTINFEEYSIYFEPITDNVGFFGIISNGNNIFEIKHLLSKKKEMLKELLHAES